VNFGTLKCPLSRDVAVVAVPPEETASIVERWHGIPLHTLRSLQLRRYTSAVIGLNAGQVNVGTAATDLPGPMTFHRVKAQYHFP
jgi:hypothetical protein